MIKIEEDVEVKTIVLKSVAQKILDLPLDSIVLAAGGTEPSSVLHRTGPNGWLTTRRPPRMTSANEKGYYNNEQALGWVGHHISRGSDFYLIRRGRESL